MREDDNNLEIIRRVNRELSDVRKEQRSIRLWIGLLLGANLLLIGGSLWVLGLGIKQLAPQETATGQPISAAEDNSAGLAGDVPDDTDKTDYSGEYSLQIDETEEVGGEAASAANGQPTAVKAVGVAVRLARGEMAPVVPAGITTREGMTLRSLARRYYGSEVFWVCIYDRNMEVLSSSDTLPPGIRLELPRPADYGIDATDPISLQRACKMAKSLAEQ